MFIRMRTMILFLLHETARAFLRGTPIIFLSLTIMATRGRWDPACLPMLLLKILRLLTGWFIWQLMIMASLSPTTMVVGGERSPMQWVRIGRLAFLTTIFLQA